MREFRYFPILRKNRLRESKMGRIIAALDIANITENTASVKMDALVDTEAGYITLLPVKYMDAKQASSMTGGEGERVQAAGAFKCSE